MKNIFRVVILVTLSLAVDAKEVDSLAAPRCQFRGRPLKKVNEIIRAVAQQPNCDDAARLAIDCSWFSSADIQINEPAFETCRNELQRNTLTSEEQALFDTMNTMCLKRFRSTPGSVDVSAESQCHLRTINWLVNLTTQGP